MSDVPLLPPFQERGSYRIIRVNGVQIEVQKKPTMPSLLDELGCSCIDTVNLNRDDPENLQVMVVDDTGMIDGKPINLLATAWARASIPGYPHNIHGDVAIVNDLDFE